MITKLKRKFIILAMVSLSLLLGLIVTGMNIINYKNIIAEADITLELLIENRGDFPATPRGNMPRWMSPELPYESRFFWVLLDKAGQAIEVHTTRISAVDKEKALHYAAQAAQSGRERGFADDYRYAVKEERGSSLVLFLDCGRKMHSFRVFLKGSIITSLAGLALVFALISFFAARIVRPVAESYEKQKRFITDAGHEIKTPLAIISANAQLLEMDIGENECLSDIRSQAQRLSSLTNDLVYLSRMEEAQAPPMVELPISDIVQEAAGPFLALAQSQGKGLVLDIQAMLSMPGEQKSLQQLISILLDNAIKYSPEGDTVCLRFYKSGKSLRLSVKNRLCRKLSPEELSHLFERFYRADPSRNSMSGGHGIGLSVAQAITTAHGGRIQALSPGDGELEMLVTFPS